MAEFNISESEKEEIKKNLIHYRNVVNYMGANVPIQVLCLPKTIENALIRQGYARVYDLINRDLTKIKGIGKARIDLLAASLDEFFTISV